MAQSLLASPLALIGLPRDLGATALGAPGGLSQVVPSLPQGTCQGLSAGRLHTLGRRQNILQLSSSGISLSSGRPPAPHSCLLRTQRHPDKCMAVPTFWFKSSLTSEISPQKASRHFTPSEDRGGASFPEGGSVPNSSSVTLPLRAV